MIQSTYIFIVKNWFKISLNKVFFFAFVLLIAINVVSALSEYHLVLESTKALFVPGFLIFYFIKNKLRNILFILFLVCSFLGDTASVSLFGDDVVQWSNLIYFLSYLCLVFIIASKFKFIDMDKVIGAYLIVILIINAYFLFALYNVLKTIIPDSDEVFVFGLKSAALIILLFVSFGVYLQTESKQSILFLMMAICFVFSDTLGYINDYYIYNWSFLMLDRACHALGLFFLFNFAMTLSAPDNKEGIMRSSSENILV